MGQDFPELGTDRFVVARHHNTHGSLSSVILGQKRQGVSLPPRSSSGVCPPLVGPFGTPRGGVNRTHSLPCVFASSRGTQSQLCSWRQLPNLSSYFAGVQTGRRARIQAL